MNNKLLRLLAVILLLVLVASAYSFFSPKITPKNTYFKYSSEDLKALKKLDSKETITSDEIYAWDEVLFDEIKKSKIPPTTASKVYSYYLVAEQDAANLSFNQKGSFQGDISPIAVAVLCNFFAEDCETFSKKASNDEYSKALASVVMVKVKERIAQDTNKSTKPQPEGEVWYGDGAVTPDAGSWKPWLIVSPEDFKASPPPKFGSTEDLAQIELVKQAVVKTTPEQLIAIKFWAGGAGSETPAGIWLKIANDYMKSHQVPLDKVLKVRAHLGEVVADSFITCWNTKFAYWTMRPVMRDPSLYTYIPTPNFPSYTSGHSTISAASATILGHYFPDNKKEFLNLAIEAKDSRLWAGIHFPIDNEVGFEVGQKIANFSLTK